MNSEKTSPRGTSFSTSTHWRKRKAKTGSCPGSARCPAITAHAMLSLSRGGSDAAVLREFDIETKAFVEGGFHLPEAKGGAAWLDADTLLLSSAYGGETMVDHLGLRANRPAVAARHRRRSGAGAVRGAGDQHGGVCRRRPHRRGAENLVHRPGRLLRSALWLGDATGAKTKLDLPTDIWIETHRDWLVVKRRSAWTVGGTTYPPDTMLGIVAVGVSCRRSQLHRSSSNPARAARCRASSGAPASWCFRSSTN